MNFETTPEETKPKIQKEQQSIEFSKKEEEIQPNFTIPEAEKMFSPFKLTENGLVDDEEFAGLGFIHGVFGPMASGKTTEMVRLVHRAVLSHGADRKKVRKVLFGYKNSHSVRISDLKYETLEDGVEINITREGISTHDKVSYPAWVGNNLFNIYHTFVKSVFGQDEGNCLSQNSIMEFQEMLGNIPMRLLPRHIRRRILENIRFVDIIGIDEGQFFPNLVEFCNIMAYLGTKVFVSGLNADFQMKPWDSIKKLLLCCDDVSMMKAICTICKKDANWTTRLTADKALIQIGGLNIYEPRCRQCFHLPSKREFYTNTQ